MYFGLSEEQEQIRGAARGFLGALPSARAVLEADPSDPNAPRADDPAIWARICEEQCWQAIPIPEALGGFGLGWVELAVVLEEVGRALTPCPLLATGLATGALLAAAPGEARDAALEAIAEGAPGALAAEGEVRLQGGALYGAAERVVGGAGAGALIVRCRDVQAARDRLVLVDGAAGVTRERLPSLDVTRPLTRIHLDGARAIPLDVDVDAALAVGEALIAAEAVGAADAILEMAVAYAKIREQFGRPIGSFQAIQHKCADMMVAVESARSAAWYAAWALDSGADDARLAARTAKAMACEALSRCAGENIQIHGGVGFTWEHDAHLYFKRARALRGLLGDPRDHRAAIADAILGPAGGER